MECLLNTTVRELMGLSEQLRGSTIKQAQEICKNLMSEKNINSHEATALIKTAMKFKLEWN